MKSKWIDHKGQKIMFCDYANFKSDLEGLKTEVSAVRAITGQQPKDSVLELIDIRNTVISTDAANLFKQASVEAKPVLHKTAVVGVTGLLNIIAKSIVKVSGLQLSLFDDIESAKDWLAN